LFKYSVAISTFMGAQRSPKRRRVLAEKITTPNAALDERQSVVVVRVGDLCQEDGTKQYDQVVPILPASSRSTTKTLLEQLVAPLDPHVFLRQCFRTCAVHCPALTHVQRAAKKNGEKMNPIYENNDQDFSKNESNDAALGEERTEWLREKLFDLDPESLLRETSSDAIFVWLQQAPSQPMARQSQPLCALPYLTAAAVSASKIQHRPASVSLTHSIEVSDADAALALHKVGHATYCRAPPHVEQFLVSSLLADTGLGCGQFSSSEPATSSGPLTSNCLGRGEVEVFMSAVAGHQTDWHYDFQENFTIQLSGVKEWTLQHSTVKHPLRGVTPHYYCPETVEPQLKAAHLADPKFLFDHPQVGVNALGDTETVVVRPGDVLYFPAGMWHKVQVNEPGVSINISLMATNYATLTCQTLQHYLLKKEEWRESVVNSLENDVIAKLKTLLMELPGIIQDFEKQGGAEAMIPPATRHGCALPIREYTSSEEEEKHDDDDDEEIEEIIDCRKPKNRSLSKFSAQDLRAQMKSHRLARNPLASLLREEEILSFYKKGDDESENQVEEDIDDDDSEVYVLNVNYAGNECHESAVRVRLRGSGVLFQAAASKEDSPLPASDDWIDSEAERLALGYLVYYGYLLWLPID